MWVGIGLVEDLISLGGPQFYAAALSRAGGHFLLSHSCLKVAPLITSPKGFIAAPRA
jgi:hypothetical protein